MAEPVHGSTGDPDPDFGSGLGLILPFDVKGLTEREEAIYTRAFECGSTYQLCRLTEDELEITMHIENAEMAIRIAEATKRSFSAEEIDERWVLVRFGAPAA